MTSWNHDDRVSEPCQEYVSLIVRAADGLLESGDRDRLDGHLTTCAACRAAVDDQRTMAALVAAAFDASPPLGFSTRVLANLEPSESWLDRLDFRRWTWRISPVAAGLALAAWLVASMTQTANAFEASATTGDGTEAAAALAWDDVMTEGDLVSVIWQAEVGDDAAATTPEFAQ